MTKRITRRTFGGLMASGASLAVLASTGGLAFADERVRLIWWGNPTRDKRTLEVVDLYHKQNPGVTIDPENYARSDYWTKLGTMAADGKLAFELEDLVVFWEYWYKMQEAGLTPPADMQAQDTGKMPEMMMLNAHSVFDFLHSNQLVGCQKLSKDEVNITMIPNQKDGEPGLYMKPSMLMSMAESSPDKEAAAKVISFFITDGAPTTSCSSSAVSPATPACASTSWPS